VYGPEKNTKDIYEDRVLELVKWVQGGGMSMLLAYGQTGSGKTFTVTELERLVVGELMDRDSSSKWDLHISVFEVAGSNMYGKLFMSPPLFRLKLIINSKQTFSKIENKSKS
jgi:kinesin family member 2/24